MFFMCPSRCQTTTADGSCDTGTPGRLQFVLFIQDNEKMNTPAASESGPYSTNQRPFFYTHATAQQRFSNPWLLGPVYNPYGISTAGIRSGNPYFPLYSVPFHEYPGYIVPQHPMHVRVNRRPYFNGHPPSPMFYQATRFRHYGPGKRTETKETQTDVRQTESKARKHQDHSIETKGCDAGNMACVPSTAGKGSESSLETPERIVSTPVSDRDFTKSSSSSVQFRSLPPPGYAFEKEEVRIEYANDGAPSIQLWKSVKETIPLYDVAKKENVVQRDVFALSSCEEVVYGSPEQGQLVPSISYPEEEKTLEDIQEEETQYKAKLDSEKQGTTNYRVSSPVDEARTMQLSESARPDQSQTKQDVLMSKRPSGLKRLRSSRAPPDVSNLVQQRELFPSGMEITNDSCFPKKLNENGDVTNKDWATSESSMWCNESEKYVPSESWLACLDSMDTNFNYEKYMSRRKHPSILSVTSDEMSSVEEDSSIDNAPMSYFVPDYMLQKSMCTFKKSTEGLGRERIKSGGSLNEDEEVEGHEKANIGYSQNLKKCSRVKAKELSSRTKKLDNIFKSSSSRQLYPHKKKSSKSLSPSEADDSEEYWVKEPEEDEEEDEEDEEEEGKEYLIQEAAPYGSLNPSKSSLYWTNGQKVFWRVPKNVVPVHALNFPLQEKVKMSGVATKLKKERKQDEELCGDFNFCLKRPTANQLEMFEPRRNLIRYSERLQEEERRIMDDDYWIKSLIADDYWMKSGARPKFASLVHSGPSTTAKSREKEVRPVAADNWHVVDSPKKKGVHKPPHKRRNTRRDEEDVQEWEKPKTSHRKGRETRRSLYKRR
uniref:Uncharacterized protein n=1 Tax=Anolis carolinensis TaxID=28377 RepID=R4G947_ANOCA